MLKRLFRRENGKRGFTMMEVVLVIGIVAVLAAIAIPTIISVNRSSKFAQSNNYAKAVYMAAQSHLMDLRSSSSLESVTPPANKIDDCKAKAQTGSDGNPEAGYIYTCHVDGAAIGEPGYYYDSVLPPDSVESVVREKQVIIEYNPSNGAVHAVFYYEGKSNLVQMYLNGELFRDSNDNDRKERKKLQLGYFQGTGAASMDTEDELNIAKVQAQIQFLDQEQGLVEVIIPMQDPKDNAILFDQTAFNTFLKNLQMKLIISGESGSVVELAVPTWDAENDCPNPAYGYAYEGSSGAVLTAKITIALDSLAEGGSFADLIQGSELLAGENVTIRVEADYGPVVAVKTGNGAETKDRILLIDGASVAGVNPMFQSVTGEEQALTLVVANGRHLQNLGRLDAELAGKVETILFAPEDKVIDWEDCAGEEVFDPIDTFAANADTLTIQGNGVTIRGLTILGEGEQDRLGLFGTLTDAVVSNLTVEAPKIVGVGDESFAAGALAGQTKDVTVTDCSVLQNEAKTGAVSNVPNAGGLVGYAVSTEFENCVAKLPVSGINGETANAGGLAGFAQDSSFKGITVELDAIPAYGTNLGGVVGRAIKEETGCSFESVKVTLKGLPSNGKYIGGLAGSLIDSTVQNTTIEFSSTTSNSVDGMMAFGGLAANAENCTIGTAGTDANTPKVTVTLKTIPQAAAAPAEKADIQHGVKVAGLVGIISGGSVNNAEIQLSSTITSTASAISANISYFGGIAVSVADCPISRTNVYLDGRFEARESAAGAAVVIADSKIQYVNVALRNPSNGSAPEHYSTATIRADHAAGFAISFKSEKDKNSNTISYCDVGLFGNASNWTAAYWAAAEKKLVIRGTNYAAGFVENNEGKISNSVVIGEVRTTTAAYVAGFAVKNTYKIDRSLSNVIMSQGNVFVLDNKVISSPIGEITNCYGWVKSGSSDNEDILSVYNSVATGMSGIVKSSYFGYADAIPTDPANPDKQYIQVIFYSANPTATGGAMKREEVISTSDALRDEYALELLNGTGTGGAWEFGTAAYPYPKIKNMGHRGTWPNPEGGNYGYGVFYYEQYVNNEWGISLTNLNAKETVTAVAALSNDKAFAAATGQDALPITGYAIFCRTGKWEELKNDQLKLTGAALETKNNQIYAIEYSETTKTLFDAAGLNRLYTIYLLVPSESNNTGEATVGSTKLNLLYGNTVGKTNDFELRTASHFSAIPENSDRNFVFTRSMTLGNHTVKGYTGTLSAASGVEITISQPLVNAASTGTLKNLTVNAADGVQLVEWVTSVEGATHYGASEILAGEITTLDGLTAIGSTTPKLTNVTIENCKLNGAAVNTKSAYFYKVSEEQYEVGTVVNAMVSIKVTARELALIAGTSNDYVSSGYYVKIGEQYERLYVQLANGIETGAYKFNIKYSSSASDNIIWETSNIEDVLTMTDSDIYAVSLPTSGEFQIENASGQKLYVTPEGTLNWAADAAGRNAFWTLSGTTLTNLGNSSVTTTLSAASGDTITNPVLVNDVAAKLYKGSVYYEIQPVTAPKYMLAA